VRCVFLIQYFSVHTTLLFYLLRFFAALSLSPSFNFSSLSPSLILSLCLFLPTLLHTPSHLFQFLTHSLLLCPSLTPPSLSLFLSLSFSHAFSHSFSHSFSLTHNTSGSRCLQTDFLSLSLSTFSLSCRHTHTGGSSCLTIDCFYV